MLYASLFFCRTQVTKTGDIIFAKGGEYMMDDSIAYGSVPVSIAARVYGKSEYWIRAGIISGYLSIGNATRNGLPVTNVSEMNSKFGRINYYISPVKLYEETGYIWRGTKTWQQQSDQK